ncbi:MAG: hypothetical protein OHK0029_25350 [Armatimonadaceae bacterium]
MKKFSCVSLAALAAGLLYSPSVFAQQENPAPAQPPVAPPPAGQQAPPPVPAPVAGQTGIRGFATWDERYLYFAFLIDDTDLLGTRSKPMEPVEQDDSIGVYFHVGGASPTPTAQTNAMIVSAAGGFRFLRGTAAGALESQPVFTIKYGVILRGTLNRSDDRDNGYVVTLAVPVDALGLDPQTLKPGTEILFNAVARRRGAEGETGRLTAIAPGTPTETEVAQPEKWGKLILTTPEDPKAAALPPAGTVYAARVAPKATAPLIDGVFRPEAWEKSGQFVFASPDAPRGAVAIQPTVLPGGATEATAPALALDTPLVGLGPRIFARYVIEYQANPRKLAAPVRGLFLEDGTLALADQPASGIGPWFSTDRTVWHFANLSDMRRVGVDVALVSYAGPEHPLGILDEKALLVMAAALRELAAKNVPAPLVAPCVDTLQLRSPGQPKPDLATAEGRETLYGAVRRWFQVIPPEFRARITLPPDSQGRIAFAYPVYLSEASGLQNLGSGEWMDEIRNKFAAEFGVASGGTTLLFCGADGFTPENKLAAVTPIKSGANGATGAGPLASVVVRPGASGLEADLQSRKNGETYREAWKTEGARAASWIVIDSWNDWLRGTEIAPSRQYGEFYLDLTRILVAQTNGITPKNYLWVSHDAPRRMQPGQLVSLNVGVRNIGVQALSGAQGVSLSYRWRNAAGEVVAEAPLRLSLQQTLIPTRTEMLSLGVLAARLNPDGKLTPLPAGEYTLEIGFTESKRDEKLVFWGEPGSTGAEQAGMNPPLRVPILLRDDLPELVEFAGTTTPPLMVGGGKYPVKLRMRWLGNEPLTPAQAQLLYQVLTEDGKNTVFSATVPLTAVLQPGVWQTVTTEFEAGSLGEPLPPAAPETRSAPNAPVGGGYRVRWLLSRKESTDAVPGEYLERIAVYPAADEGTIIPPDKPIRDWKARALREITVTVTNRSSAPWEKEAVSVGYHWYYPDGIEYEWNPNLTAPLPRTVKPGESVKVNVPVRAPDRDGEYILAFDILRNPDVYLSTLPVTRSGDLALLPVRVNGGRLSFVDLTKVYSLDAIATEQNPGDGNLDGNGSSLPAESFPPDNFGIAAYFSVTEDGKPASDTPVYPSGHFSNVSKAARMVSFRYGSDADGAKNAVPCNGQTVDVPKGKFATLHLAATATGGEDRKLTLTLRYKDGSTSSAEVMVGDWNRAPGPNEAVAIRTFRKRTKDGDTTAFAGVRHLIVPVDITREIVSVTLPQDEKLKIFAMTLEK